MADDTEDVVVEESMDDFMGAQFDAIESESPSEDTPAQETQESTGSSESAEPPKDTVAEATDSDTDSDRVVVIQ